MKAAYEHRTIVTGTSTCEWTCGPGAIRAFFALAPPRDEAPPLRFGDLSGPVAIVTDENVDRLYAGDFPPAIPRAVVPPGESSKTFGRLAELLRRLLDAGLDRSGTVVACGGGVVGDLAGFAAATFMRGIRWVNVPTTVLAMVDSSIGGKTGVDVGGVKNLAGAFHPPVAIVCDPLVLKTLPPEERVAGMAEVLKQAVIGDHTLFERLEAGAFDDSTDIASAARVKIEIVERDPLERGTRAVLNLGHTVGHGVETASGFRLTHGQAVAIGLVAESRIAETIGLAAEGVSQRIRNVVGRLGLPTRASMDPWVVRRAMSSDKKRTAGRLNFVLPRAIGDVIHGVEVEERAVMEALGEVCGRGE